MPRAALALALAALAVLMPSAPSAASPPLTYLALGDSTAVGVGAASGGGYPERLARLLKARGVAVKLVNLGVSGATAADLRRDQLPQVQGTGAGLVTLCIGINDVLRDRPLDAFAQDLHAVVEALARANAGVVLCELPDLSSMPAGLGAPPELRGRVEQYNQAIRAEAGRHAFGVVDLFEVSRSTRGQDRAALFSPDGFHPSAAGYDRWAEVMWPAVERAVAQRLQASGGSAPPR